MSRNHRAPGTTLRIASILAAIFLAAVHSFAGQDYQDNYFGGPGGKWEIGLTFGGAFPTGAFRDNLGHDGFSLDLFAGSRLGNSPFTFGLDVFYMIYGLRSRDEYIGGDIPVQVNVETSNNVLQGLLYLKCQPRNGRMRPYVEVLAGFSYLYTRTSLSGTEYPYDEIVSDTNFDDTTLCEGGGIGVDILLKRGRRNTSGGRGSEIRLDFKVRYLLGGRAQYLRDDSILYEDGRFTYLYRESATNLVSAQAGLLFVF